MDDVGTDVVTVQGEGSQGIGDGEGADPMPPPSQSSLSRRTGHEKSATVKNGMETEDLFAPTALPLPADRQVWDQSYILERRTKWLSPSYIIELLLAPDNHEVAVMDVGWKKKWVAAAMDLGSRMKWGAYMGIFFVLMLVISTTPRDVDCHEFADQRTLFLGIPNTLNVVSTIPFFFVGLTGLILKHCKSYYRLCEQGGLYALLVAGIISVGLGSSYYHINPRNGTLFWDTLLMMVAFTSFEAVFVIERFDDWAGTKSLASTSYWIWAAGFYVLAKVEEAADKPIYRWTLQIVSGHTLGHLCAAMVPLFLIIMLAKRTRPIEPERHRILMHHQLKPTFMICLLVPKMIFLWVPKIQVSAIMYEISILIWECGARYVTPFVNKAKTSEKGAMLQTPIRARQIIPRIRGLRGMDIYKNKVLEFLQSDGSNESFFGLWGVSGVGKTRLLSLIADSYADSFSYVIFLDAASSVRVMQNHLAHFLKLDWEGISLPEEHYRAEIIKHYLEHNSFLLLLDNLQDGYYPDLIEAGLPITLGRRQKVVMTSRNQLVCVRMGCSISNTLEMKCLGDEDAWSLFKYNAGVEITEADTEIYKFAKQMVLACEGLPRAICAIGIGIAGATCRGKHPADWWFAYKRFKAKNLPPERMEEIVAVLV